MFNAEGRKYPPIVVTIKSWGPDSLAEYEVWATAEGDPRVQSPRKTGTFLASESGHVNMAPGCRGEAATLLADAVRKAVHWVIENLEEPAVNRCECGKQWQMVD